MTDYAQIVSFEEFNQIRAKKDLGKIVCTSGGFDPIHPGHMTCIVDSKKHGDTLVILVNGDWFLQNKKGKEFMNLDTRCRIVSCIREVDYVIPFEVKDDTTVCKALELLKPDVFTKGGDRTDYTNIPEWDVCQKYNITLVPQVGLDKSWSSSDFLKEWTDYFRYRDVKPYELVASNLVAPEYIEIGGHTYERLNDDTVNVDLELEEDVIEELENFMKSNNFVSTGEALRFILREEIKRSDLQDLNEKDSTE